MLAAIAALALFQTHATDVRKQVESLVSQIDRLAASEPTPYGIDTRIRVAEVLTPGYPAIAKRRLRDAEASLSGVSDPDYANQLRVRISTTLAPLDFAEAERVAKSIGPERKHDRLAEAYGHLLERAGKRDSLDLILTAYHSGAFRLYFDPKNFRDEQMLQIFAAVVDAFPSDTAELEDISYLLDAAKKSIAINRELSLTAIRKAAGAADHQPKSIRSQIRFQAAELLRSLGTKLPDEFEPLLLEPEPPKEKPEEKKKDDEEPDLSGVPYAEALERSLKLENPEARAGSLINISRREDLSPKQQARVAAEALTAVGQLPLGEVKLLGYSMLSRDFAKRQELANAALAAQMLSDTYSKACDCGAPVCEANGDKFQCVELVNDYAEYLDELNFTQESLGLNNISLEARLLITKLKKLAGTK
jgi:hypothetical protein